MRRTERECGRMGQEMARRRTKEVALGGLEPVKLRFRGSIVRFRTLHHLTL